MPIRTLSKAIFHDYFAIAGGGERLVLTLSNHFRMPVITAFVNKKLYRDVGWIGAIRPILPSVPGKSPLTRALAAMITFSLMPGWCAQKIETVIYSGNYAPLARRRLECNFHVMYCHTIPRFLGDLQAEFLQSVPGYLLPSYRLMLRLYKSLYLLSVKKIDLLIANSRNVRRRIKSFTGRQSLVIYPPCDTSSFKFMGQDDYYLSTARLEPQKNVDRVVEAFKKMPDKRLVVVSGGSQYKKILELASEASNVHVLGWVSDRKLKELIGRCIATVYVPTNEDFGMSPVESMAAGKPVIGVSSGGLTETIIHGRTGYLLPENWTQEDMVRAVKYLNAAKAFELRRFCEERAECFDESIFLEKMAKVIKGEMPYVRDE
ncbi:glycosyltransferase [Thermodesulforhabdus norvegica]|uniref:Glycosyltransferase involved in cell wall bisynthesis n=1 Tax=Thermodesulforhabdus norvegica TaxID=39841 RepID=A0A1I4TWJ6_9BACT|nr:glycosyltransferase [Thermodesulforhabdus norvegica]SFM81148.1 Glycosyltransferase involved in cell wall bisynthesis [Thermodesulforhabdus norvegica]